MTAADHALKIGYVIIGALVALYFLAGTIGSTISNVEAYKHPAVKVQAKAKAKSVEQKASSFKMTMKKGHAEFFESGQLKLVDGEGIAINDIDTDKKTETTASSTLSISTPILPGGAYAWGIGAAKALDTSSDCSVIVQREIFKGVDAYATVDLSLAPFTFRKAYAGGIIRLP